MRTVRNVAIIAVLAIPVAFVPGGGDAAQGVITALQIAFLAALGALGFQLYRQSKLTLLGMRDAHRAVFYGALGVIALMVAGGGSLLWIGLMVAAGAAIFWVWREAQTY
jgi:hypothetical protein